MELVQNLVEKEGLMLTPDDVAPILGSTPQTIRETARNNPELIGFPFTFTGKNMRIPKLSFLKFLGVESFIERKENEQ